MNRKFIILFLFFFLFACGGGGGSSGDSGQTGSISYSGSTSQAAIDNTNAKTLTSEAYDGGSLGGGFVSKPEGESPSLYNILYDIANEVSQNINQEIYNKPYEKSVTVSGTVTGSCGGTLSYTLTGDDSTGSLSGTFTASNYCSLGIPQRLSYCISLL